MGDLRIELQAPVAYLVMSKLRPEHVHILQHKFISTVQLFICVRVIISE